MRVTLELLLELTGLLLRLEAAPAPELISLANFPEFLLLLAECLTTRPAGISLLILNTLSNYFNMIQKYLPTHRISREKKQK